MNSPKSKNTPGATPQARNAPLRIGLIGGCVLALAMAAQRVSTDEQGAMFGLMIVSLGWGVVGYFAARDAFAASRREGARAGAIAGLIAGLLTSLSFVGVTLLQSFDPAVLSAIEKQALTTMPPEQLAQARELGWAIKDLVQVSLTMIMMCCGVGLPAMGTLFGAMGGSAAGAANSVKE